MQLEEEVDGETMLDLEALVSASFNTMLKGANYEDESYLFDNSLCPAPPVTK